LSSNDHGLRYAYSGSFALKGIRREVKMDFVIPDQASAKQTMVVERAHAANEIGSGSVEVLATPMMIALMEAAAVDAVQKYLPEGWTTVGTRVDVEHLRATPIGGVVTAEATLAKREGRVLEYAVAASDRTGIIGQGNHQRYIINLEKFMERLQR
jgi:predicted thioesterase